MTRAHWRCDAQNTQQAFPTEREADAEAIRLQPTQTVVWFCAGNWGGDGPETHVIAPVSDSGGVVGSKVIRKLLGRQIEDERDAS